MNRKLKVFIRTNEGKRFHVGNVVHLRSIHLTADISATLDLINFEITYNLPKGLILRADNGMNFSSIRIKVKGK